jgi:hypothetical protein
VNGLGALNAATDHLGFFPAAPAFAAIQPEAAALIRWLGELFQPAPAENTETVEREEAEAVAVPASAAPDVIAHALVRSMLAEGWSQAASSLPASLADDDEPVPPEFKVEQPACPVAVTVAQPVQPGLVPEAPATPVPASNWEPQLRPELGLQTLPGGRGGEAQPIPVPSRQQPLAFELRLTPLVESERAPQEHASSAGQEKHPSEANPAVPLRAVAAPESEAALDTKPAVELAPAQRTAGPVEKRDAHGERDSREPRKTREAAPFRPAGPAQRAEPGGFPAPPLTSVAEPAARGATAAAAPPRSAELRAPESSAVAPAPPPPRPAAAEIGLRIARPDAAPVDVRVVERAGQVHVDVRTADQALQQALRAGLGALTESLAGAGYRAEAVTSEMSIAAAPEPRVPRAQPEQPVKDSPGEHHSGRQQHSQQQPQQQQHRRPPLARWLEVLERVA